LKGIIVRHICGGGCNNACVDEEESDHYTTEEHGAGKLWCSAKQEFVDHDDEGCEIALPITCPKCSTVVIEDNE
jgi:hypothetical protein